MTGAVDRFGASRDRYLGGDTVFCVGNAAECDHYTEDGGVRIPWGGTPEDLSQVRDLALYPTDAQLRKAALPAYLPDLVNLEALTLPAPHAVRLTPGSVGAGVRTLVLGNPDGQVPAAPLAADAVLPGLRALMWVSSLTTPTLPRSSTRCHHWSSCTRTSAGTCCDRSATCRRCGTVFGELPELVQLTVLNSKKITNVDALLDCRNLASVTFVNCGNPFRKDGKARFGAKGFAHLDIAYS